MAKCKIKLFLSWIFNKKLSKKEIALIPRSYDVLGDLLIFSDFPDRLIGNKKEKLVAERIMDKKKNVKVVLRKTGNYSGVFRTPQLKILGGENRKETTYRENGIRLMLNPEAVYFSPRTSTERKRIFQQVKDGEDILVMFSGAGPLPVVLSKNTKAKEIYGIEINPEGHRYALKSVEMNKIKNVKLFCGDVNKVLLKINKKFDRILMPLPKDAHTFLGLALSKIKKNGIIHLYDFEEEKNIPSAVDKKISNACKKAGKKYKLLDVVKCGQYGPHKHRTCADFKVY
ncbi:MAG: class I SAM-dependent methyltransferase family protein [Nanoarchaeota archaeon]|nr:class I SAM-dependent methyltransferase family protein [Nanoarchaeota archaeon]